MSENWVDGTYESGADPTTSRPVNDQTGAGRGERAEPQTGGGPATSESWVDGTYESGADPIPTTSKPVNDQTGVGLGERAEPSTFEPEEDQPTEGSTS